MNPTTLFAKWLNQPEASGGIKSYHPKVIGFEKTLRKLRSRPSERVLSVARIALPFQVEPRTTAKFNLGWEGSECQIVMVDLSPRLEDYEIESDNEPFEKTPVRKT